MDIVPRSQYMIPVPQQLSLTEYLPGSVNSAGSPSGRSLTAHFYCRCLFLFLEAPLSPKVKTSESRLAMDDLSHCLGGGDDTVTPNFLP